MKLIIKKDGICKEIEVDESILKALNPSDCHMCWKDCKNAIPNKCEKIKDIHKQLISAYDYISDGYQLINDNGLIDIFYVEKCDNYELEEPKKFDFKEINRRKDALRQMYFGTENVDGALLLQDDLLKRGNISITSGLRPDPAKIRRLRLKYYNKDYSK